MSRHHKDANHAEVARIMRPRIQAALPLPCIRCGRVITPDMAWDVGHRQDLALGGDRWDVGPEHRGRCNRRAGGKLGAAITNRRHALRHRRDPADQRLPQW